jgi:hypothetical protein
MDDFKSIDERLDELEKKIKWLVDAKLDTNRLDSSVIDLEDSLNKLKDKRE